MEYHAGLHRFIQNRVSNLSVADDILQEVLFRIHSHIDTLKESSKIQSGIYQIARNAIIDHYRAHKTTKVLPNELKQDIALYTGCIAGASFVNELETILKEAGFVDIRIRPKDESREFINNWVPGRKVEDYVVSATIEAVKP